MPAEVRRGVKADAASIARFQALMAKETEDKTLDDAIVLTAVNRVFDDQDKGFYYVAEAGGKVVGSLLITFEWSDWRDSNIWYIQSVYVEKDYRGQGIFTQMYESVVADAKESDVKHIRLYVETDNAKAQGVYEKLGMKRLPYFMYDAKL